MSPLPLGLGPAGDAYVFGFVREIARDDRRRKNAGGYARYGGAVLVVEDDTAIAYGGAFNTDDYGRVGYGFTLADMHEARTGLKRLGILRTADQVDGLLMQAQDALGRGIVYNPVMSQTQEQRREHWRTKRARRIAALRAAGTCIICGRTPAGEGRSTCTGCSARAYDYKTSKGARSAA